MEIEGNVFKIGEKQSGISKNGNPWRKQEYIVEFFEHETDMLTQKMVLSLIGDKIESFDLHVGDKITLKFWLAYREWEGRFFQEVRIVPDSLRVISRLTNADTTSQQQQQNAETATDQPKQTENEKGDDLPF